MKKKKKEKEEEDRRMDKIIICGQCLGKGK